MSRVFCNTFLIFFWIHCVTNATGQETTGLPLEAKNGIDQAIQDGIRNYNLRKRFSVYFACAMNVWKTSSERVYRQPPEVCNKDELEKMDFPSIPEDISALNSSNDAWIDDFQASSASSSKTTISKFEKIYRQWYCRLTTPNVYAISGFLSQLRSKLQQLQSFYPAFYKKDGIFVRFAANMARGWRIACACDSLITRLQEQLLKNSNIGVVQNLLKLAPGWNVTQELVTYVNILQLAIIPLTTNGNNGHSLPSNYKPIECYRVQAGLNGLVIIPYWYYDECELLEGSVTVTNNYELTFRV